MRNWLACFRLLECLKLLSIQLYRSDILEGLSAPNQGCPLIASKRSIAEVPCVNFLQIAEPLGGWQDVSSRGDNMFILWWIVMGSLAGWVTGKMMNSSAFGWVKDISSGIAGAIIGGFVMRGFGFSAQGGSFYAILVATMGAALLTLVVRVFLGRKNTQVPTS